jgi:hypothetical protein
VKTANHRLERLGITSTVRVATAGDRIQLV